METIKHAAVKALNGQIFMGKEHAECYKQAHHIGVKLSLKADDQGFITSTGRFVGRYEAFNIAQDAGQFKPSQHDLDSRYVGNRLLFSEYLWDDVVHNGINNYNYIEGYTFTKEEVFMSKQQELTHEEYLENLHNTDKKYVLKFWAEWCVPCKRYNAVVEDVASHSEIPFYTVNVDRESKLVELFKVKGIPLTVVIHGNMIKGIHSGAIEKEKLLEAIKD